jgi:hypothetical protein
MQGYLRPRNRYAMRQAALAANMSHVRICASRMCAKSELVSRLPQSPKPAARGDLEENL